MNDRKSPKFPEPAPLSDTSEDKSLPLASHISNESYQHLKEKIVKEMSRQCEVIIRAQKKLSPAFFYNADYTLSIFYKKNATFDLNVEHFLNRFIDYVSMGTLIYSKMILDQYLNLSKDNSLNERNYRNILLVILMTAHKFCDDTINLNGVFAKIAMMELRDLNQLEIEFLKKLDFSPIYDAKLFEETAHALLPELPSPLVSAEPSYSPRNRK